MNTDASLQGSKLHDVTNWGLRASIGVIFIFHSLGKFEPGFANVLPNMGLPPEMQFPIALAEFLGGIFLIAGVFTRLSGSVLSIIMLGAIFHLKWESGFSSSDGGWEWDLELLAGSLLVIAAGPGRISISHLVRRLPRCLH